MKTIIAILALVTAGFTPPTDVILSEDLPNDGILTVPAGDLGVYKIDTRFNLCFLKSSPYIQVVKIPCKSFDNMHGNE